MSKRGKLLRLDGWQNILTGLGFKSKDKRMHALADYSLISEGEVEALYASDELAQKIVNKLPEDMMREGFRLTSPIIEDEVLNEAVDEFERLIQVLDSNRFTEGMQWGRLYGGAALVIGADDTDERFNEPIDTSRMRRIEYLTLLNRFELAPQTINGDPRSPNFGMPETYIIQPRVTPDTRGGAQFSDGLTLTEIHYTRLIRFDGSRLPRRQFIQNTYWHDSILNKLHDAIRDYQNAFASASALVLDFAQAVYKIKNLADIVGAPDGIEILERRIAIVERSRSILRAALVDADKEDFERKSTTLAGLPDTLDKLARKFSASTEYPHTILLNESPGGNLGGTGESEKRDYEDVVRGAQLAVLKPRLKQFFNLLFLSREGPTKGRLEPYDIEFNTLRQLSQAEKLEARERQAKIDQIYINTGVVDSTEVALSRYGTGEYSFETEINEALRKMETVEPEGNTLGDGSNVDANQEA